MTMFKARRLNSTVDSIVNKIGLGLTLLMAIISSWVIEINSAVAAEDRNLVAQISSACTPEESWHFGAWQSPSMRSTLKHPPHDQDEALAVLYQGYSLKMVSRRADFQTLGDYLVYRAYHELHLYHFAQRGFYSILNRPIYPGTIDVSIAALGCLHQMYEKYPAMNISLNVGQHLTAIPVERLRPMQKLDFWKSVFTVARGKIAARVKTVDVSAELALLRGSGPYELFIHLLDASLKGNETDILNDSLKLLAYRALPKQISAELDSVYINLARVYYQRGEYDKSTQMFKRVKQDARDFTASLSDRAWAFLMKKDYSGASAAAFNFRVGELRNVFAPDAMVILAISYYENCHYQASLDMLKDFNKAYNKTYKALYDWYYQQRTAPVDYYSIALKYIAGNTNLVPKNVALEWLRSGRFIAQQQEVNLLFDENESARKLANVLGRKLGRATGDQRKFLMNLRNAMVALVKNIPELQKNLINRINSEILWHNYTMIAALVDSFENRQLLEVEILRTMGENVLNKQVSVKNAESAVKSSVTKKHDDDLVPVLNWGYIPPDEPENVEVWKDELGDIETNVANICTKK